RKITFLIGLGMIMGSALIDVSLILFRAYRRARQRAAKPVEQEDWKRTNFRRLIAWVVFWGIGIVVMGSQVLHEPVGYLIFAVLLVFVFALVNGISVGMVDSNPISSAFVVTVILMAAVGLKDPTIGLMAATVLRVSTSEACDMQQDRSTGWRLGTNRTIQFRFQVAGIVMGAIMAVVFAKLFMNAYPVLQLDQTALPADQQPANWTSAMTYKFVGVLRSLTDDKPYQRTAIWIGVAIGFAANPGNELFARGPGRGTMPTASPLRPAPHRARKASLYVVGCAVAPLCRVRFRRAMPTIRTRRGRHAPRSVAGLSIRQLVEA